MTNRVRSMEHPLLGPRRPMCSSGTNCGRCSIQRTVQMGLPIIPKAQKASLCVDRLCHSLTGNPTSTCGIVLPHQIPLSDVCVRELAADKVVTVVRTFKSIFGEPLARLRPSPDLFLQPR